MVCGEGEDSDKTDKLLCGAVKHLRNHRAKPNQQIVLALMVLVKEKPLLFTTDVATGVCMYNIHSLFLCIEFFLFI